MKIFEDCTIISISVFLCEDNVLIREHTLFLKAYTPIENLRYRKTAGLFLMCVGKYPNVYFGDKLDIFWRQK